VATHKRGNLPGRAGRERRYHATAATSAIALASAIQ
jgi:hypothetical protein